MQPLFSDKFKKSQNIVLIENNTTITDEKEIANKINKKPTTAATISHVNKPWSPVYSGEYI